MDPLWPIPVVAPTCFNGFPCGLWAFKAAGLRASCMGFWADGKEPNQLHDAVHRQLLSNLAQLAGRQAHWGILRRLFKNFLGNGDAKAEWEHVSSLCCASPSFLSSAAVCLVLRADLHWEPGWLWCLMFAFTCTIACSMVWNYIVSCNGVGTHYLAGPVPFWYSLWSWCFWTKLGFFKMLLFHTNRKNTWCTDIDWAQ